MHYPIAAPKSVMAGVAAALMCLSLPVQAQAPVKPKAAPPPSKSTSQPAAKTEGSGDVVARVGNITLSASDVHAYIASLGERERTALADNPALLSQAVRLTLANRLVLHELQARKWDQRPDIAAQLDRVRQNALIELYLQSVSVPPANFPSAEELQKVYEANRGALLMPRQLHLAEILVPVAKDADKTTEEQTKKNIDEIQRRLKAAGADFAAIATESGARNGGDLGWVVEGQIHSEIRGAVTTLAKGTMTEPIRLEDGWRIVKLVDTKEAYTRTLPEVREQLVQQIRSERMKMLRQAYLAELLQRNPPVLNEMALSGLIDKAPR